VDEAGGWSGGDGDYWVEWVYVVADDLAIEIPISNLTEYVGVIPNQAIVTAYLSPHPQPFSRGRREQDSKSLSRAGFRVRVDCYKHSLIWY
jgi:hypothetical protein